MHRSSVELIQLRNVRWIERVLLFAIETTDEGHGGNKMLGMEPGIATERFITQWERDLGLTMFAAEHAKHGYLVEDHHRRSHISTVPGMFRNRANRESHSLEGLTHLLEVRFIDGVTPCPHRYAPIPFLAMGDRLTHRLFPRRNDCRVTREMGGINKPQ